MPPDPSDPNELTHRDIFLRLGEVAGQIEFIKGLLQNKREDIDRIATRLIELEKKVAVGVFLAIAASVVIPVVTTYASTRLTEQLTADEIEELRLEIDTLRKLRRKLNDPSQTFVSPHRFPNGRQSERPQGASGLPR